MKITVVNNGSLHLDSLATALGDHDLHIIGYEGSNVQVAPGSNLIILSGSAHQNETTNSDITYREWFEAERRLIREASVPILGICLGFELICEVFGQAHRLELPVRMEGQKRIVMTTHGVEVFGLDNAVAYEGHKYAIEFISTSSLQVLAKSVTGIEAVKHREMPIMGVQFHPEVGERSLLMKCIEGITA